MDSRESAAVGSLVELLIDTADPDSRERILMEAALASDTAQAVALWRATSSTDEEGAPRRPRTSTGPTSRGTVWREILARGPRDLLPTGGQVQAVAEGSLPSQLPGRRHILIARSGTSCCALALGGVSDEGDIDVLEALLETAAVVRRAEIGEGSDLLRNLSAPLPRGSGPTAARDRKLRHDLRNLLTSIRATQDLLDNFVEDLGAEEEQHFRDVLVTGYRRAGDLLVSALRDSTEEPEAAPEKPGVRRQCRVGDVLRDVAAIETPALMVAGIDLELSIEAELEEVQSPITDVDLSRVVANLIVNARDSLAGARTESPLVEMSLAADESSPGELCIRVADNGPGVAEGDLERIFEEGFTQGKAHGTGMGLATVRELLERAGGRVVARSRDGGGICFFLSLPSLPLISEA